MSISVLLLATIAGALTGRAAFGSWFNHVSHYSLVWGASLILFELRFIDYYPLSAETWTCIAVAWVSFTVGALLMPLAVRGPGHAAGTSPGDPSPRRLDEARLRNVIIVLSLASGFGVAQHWIFLLNRFGSVFNVIVFGNIVYALRLQEGVSLGLPYLDSLALPASFFGGLYIATRRRFSLLAFLPLLVVIAETLGLMGRMKLLMSVILFFGGYFLAGRPDGASGRRVAAPLAMRWATIGIAVLLFVVSLEIVRSNRGSIESIPGAGGALRSLRGGSFITPSLYLYLTVDHGVFNQYLEREEERSVPGANTFAPVYRALSQFGLDLEVREYQQFYSTPASANTGSYLREVHADFGAAGILVLPFLLGMLCSIFWKASLRKGGLPALAVLVHLFVLVDVSIIVMATRTGYWFVSLLAGLVSARYIAAGRVSHPLPKVNLDASGTATGTAALR